MRKIILNLKSARYLVYIGNEIFYKLPEICKRHRIKPHIAVITDETVAELYLDELLKILKGNGFYPEPVILKPGESSKSLNVVSKVYTDLIEMKLRRDETVIAFGGGVVGDIAGFVSATYLRGVNLIHLPTTLLAQVDSSIGGKVGVNHKLGKNLIGAFYHPVFVFSDVSFLRTLPKRELICGLGEVIKYGIIMDEKIFETIEMYFEKTLNFDFKIIQNLVYKSVAVKSSIVQRDEKEKRLRMILNFGHTIGHGIEAGLNYKKLKHGEAVLLGMLGESLIALKRGILKMGDFERIKEIVFKTVDNFPQKVLAKDVILKHIGYDKKISSELIKMYLPVRIGKMKFFSDVRFDEIEDATEFLLNIKQR